VSRVILTGIPGGQAPRWGRPTVYKGIRMRSRLEARWAASFDEEVVDPTCWLVSWEYEPCAFANESDQYLPDFRLSYRGENGEPVESQSGTVYLDVKGMLEDPFPVMARMETILSSERDVGLHLIVGSPEEPSRWWSGIVEDNRLAWYNVNDFDTPVRMRPL